MCEICKTQYLKKEYADYCESQGLAEDNELPVGLIFSFHHKDMVFVIAKNESIGHFNTSLAWACRDTGAGDNMISYCSGITLSQLKSHPDNYNANTKIPAYKRMIEGLKNKGIKPILAKDYLISLQKNKK